MKIFFSFFAFIIASFANAHPPADMKVSYQMENNAIKINVRHMTLDNQKHFIDEIED